MSLEVVDVRLDSGILPSHVCDIFGGFLQYLSSGGLLAVKRGHGVPQTAEAVLNVVASLALECVVVRPLVCLGERVVPVGVTTDRGCRT